MKMMHKSPANITTCQIEIDSCIEERIVKDLHDQEGRQRTFLEET